MKSRKKKKGNTGEVNNIVIITEIGKRKIDYIYTIYISVLYLTSSAKHEYSKSLSR